MNHKKETIGACELYLGDSAEVLPELGGGAFAAGLPAAGLPGAEPAAGLRVDALITDPPYASGGLSTTARTRDVVKKYTNKSSAASPLPPFAGDTLDQRCWGKMLSGVLQAAEGVLKESAIYCLFIDWRQLPALMDLLMLEGWPARGVAVWNKLLSRPLPNGFAQTAEFIVWGRKKIIPQDGAAKPADALYLPGVFTVENEMNRPGANKERYHVTQKPLQLMKQLLAITLPGDVVLDPFMGGGTTGVACVQMGRRFIGIEKDERYFEIACKRIRDAASQGELTPPAYTPADGGRLDFSPAHIEEEEF